MEEEDDDSTFLEMFSLSSSNIGSKSSFACLSSQCNRFSEESSSLMDSCRLVDIEDPERSESTTFYLDVPPISPNIHFVSKKSQSEPTMEGTS